MVEQGRKLPETIDEAVDYLMATLSPERVQQIKTSHWADLHWSLGTGIRNDLGLWGQNEALCQACELEHWRMTEIKRAIYQLNLGNIPNNLPEELIPLLKSKNDVDEFSDAEVLEIIQITASDLYRRRKHNMSFDWILKNQLIYNKGDDYSGLIIFRLIKKLKEIFGDSETHAP